MRKRTLTLSFILLMTAAMATGCSSTGSTSTSSSSSTEASSSDAIYGEVSSISDDSITIKVGTVDMPEVPDNSEKKSDDSSDGNSGDSSSDSTADNKSDDSATDSASSDQKDDSSSDSNSDSSDSSSKADMQNAPGSIDISLTGEEETLTLTDSTTYTTMFGGMGMGQQPSRDNNGSGSSDSTAQQPPEMPSGDNNGGNGGNSGSKPDGSQDNQQPPEMPSGDNNGGNGGNSGSKPGGSQDNQQPPEKPSGDSNGGSSDSTAQEPSGDNNGGSGSSDSTAQEPSGNAPSAPDGNGGGQPQGQTITADDISEGDIVSIKTDEDGNVTEITLVQDADGQTMGGQPGGQGGNQSSSNVSYSAVKEYTEDTDLDGETVDSTGTDEEGVWVSNGANVTFSNGKVTRTSSDSTGGDNSSFYGVGAALLNTEGTLIVKDSDITTDAAGGAGVFSYGDGVTYVSDSTIKTTQDTSGGIHVAGGGTLYAWDLDVETSGESSAAIRSDRGSGTMVVDGGTYTSNGTGSPAIYSTADISVHDATLTANQSEAICIEGMNSIRLFDCDLTGNMKDDSQNDNTWNVILYQSMSGDSEEGNSTFEMNGGSLTARNGGMFYTTNTQSTFTLKNVDITYADENDYFLRCTGNSNKRGWGTSGSNGADCLFTAIDQDCKGDVIWDSISQLDFYLTDDSALTGAVTQDESCAGDGGSGYCNLYIGEGSIWTVTGDSTLSALYNDGTIQDEDGNSVTIKDTEGNVLAEGDSEYTITVSSYEDSADVTDASTISDWSDYEVEQK